jgi:endonuclease/exonuclease/phosphatase family metal-dependent hydrolase
MNATHAQVNRPLRDEFAQAIAGLEWDVALLQEAPPSWLPHLAESAAAGGTSALTSRNFAAALRSALARFNPDLIASNEGGSNQLLVRPPWRLGDVLRLTLTLRPERRAMLCALLHGPDGRDLLVANLHASAAFPAAAAREVLAAAETVLDLADGTPMILGGDLNLRPAQTPEPFEELERRFGIDGPLEPRSLDHLLVRGLDVIEPEHALPTSAREAPGPAGRVVQLSDHPLLAGTFGMK